MAQKDLYKGEFDQGWDILREEILAAADQLGIVPPGTKLAENPDNIQKWETSRPTRRRCSRARWRCTRL